jgi:hypothetical protein
MPVTADGSFEPSHLRHLTGSASRLSVQRPSANVWTYRTMPFVFVCTHWPGTAGFRSGHQTELMPFRSMYSTIC